MNRNVYRGFILPYVMCLLSVTACMLIYYLSDAIMAFHITLNHYQQAKNFALAENQLHFLQKSFSGETHCIVTPHAVAWFAAKPLNWWQSDAVCKVQEAKTIIAWVVIPLAAVTCTELKDKPVRYYEIIVHVGQKMPVNLCAFLAIPSNEKITCQKPLHLQQAIQSITPI